LAPIRQHLPGFSGEHRDGGGDAGYDDHDAEEGGREEAADAGAYVAAYD
jgi:hypothetical protein